MHFEEGHSWQPWQETTDNGQPAVNPTVQPIFMTRSSPSSRSPIFRPFSPSVQTNRPVHLPQSPAPSNFNLSDGRCRQNHDLESILWRSSFFCS